MIRDASGKPILGTGKGSDADLSYNPYLNVENSSAPSDPMPSDAILFHELEHANHTVNGTIDASPRGEGWDTQEEETTIRSGASNETTYLQERGYPWRRTNHSTSWAGNP